MYLVLCESSHFSCEGEARVPRRWTCNEKEHSSYEDVWSCETYQYVLCPDILQNYLKSAYN